MKTSKKQTPTTPVESAEAILAEAKAAKPSKKSLNPAVRAEQAEAKKKTVTPQVPSTITTPLGIAPKPETLTVSSKREAEVVTEFGGGQVKVGDVVEHDVKKGTFKPAKAEAIVGPEAQKQAAKAAKKVEEEGKKAEYDNNTVVVLTTQVNPKKAGTASFDRFEKYVDGMTVTAALAVGITRDDLRWDSKHNYISLKPVVK